MANDTLLKEIKQILKVYPEFNSKTITPEEYQELNDLVHTTLVCAYDDKYDKNFVEKILQTQFLVDIETNHNQYYPELTVVDDPIAHEQPNFHESHVDELLINGSDAKKAKIKELYKRTKKNAQGTQEWLNDRHNYISGSITAHAANHMGYIARLNLILEKATFGEYRTFFGGKATHYGTRYESVSNDIYCYRNNTQIHEFGIIPHKNISFLGASTDGVSNELRNIEIKSPYSRVPNGKVKKEYMHQMQSQMECLGLIVTDFIEVKYQEYNGLNEMLKRIECNPEYGCMIEIHNTTTNQLEYIYSPIKLCEDSDQLANWVDYQHKKLTKSANQLHVRDIYWRVEVYSCIEIKKDPNWLKNNYDELKKFWDEVIELRNNKEKLNALLLDRELKKSMRRNQFKEICMI